MADGYTVSAVTAAVSVARRLGLPAADPLVLHERSNVLVTLGEVVARVPGTTRLLRDDPAAALGRDVALSAFLAERGVSVVSPVRHVPAGPHFAEGLPVTLWRFVPHDPDHRFAPADVAASLARLHACLREYPGELAAPRPLDVVRRMVDRMPELARVRGTLAGAVEALARRLPDAPSQALHGDAHAGNLVAAPDGPCWLDFEDTWHGPLGWDLAALARSPRLDGEAALAAYPARPEPAELAAWTGLRTLFGVCWLFVVSRRFPHRLNDAEGALERYLRGPAGDLHQAATAAGRNDGGRAGN